MKILLEKGSPQAFREIVFYDLIPEAWCLSEGCLSLLLLLASKLFFSFMAWDSDKKARKNFLEMVWAFNDMAVPSSYNAGRL